MVPSLIEAQGGEALGHIYPVSQSWSLDLIPSHLSHCCSLPLPRSSQQMQTCTVSKFHLSRVKNGQDWELGLWNQTDLGCNPKGEGQHFAQPLGSKSIKVTIFASLVLLPICLCHSRPGTPSPARFQARNAFTSYIIHIVMFEVFVGLYQKKWFLKFVSIEAINEKVLVKKKKWRISDWEKCHK